MATTIGQYIYKVLDTVSGKTITTENFDPTKEVAGNFTKLSFQAPTGTNIIIDDKTVIVGRSGYYEVPEGITVRKFIMKAGMIYTPSKIDNSIYYDLLFTTNDLSSQIREKMAGLNNTTIIDKNNFENAYQAYINELEKEPTVTTSVPLENIIIDYVIESQDGAQTGGEN